ncbi:hypothetical protein LQR30_16875 [Chromobacterium piscinae]|uniref:hypothetical protein n=1 Tax=Chromobacterium piscinae TaxID=686831 RepID=UPI001E2FDD12|nr:hypothetical protein [Chromobacterium piscinae]MCD4505769.1 hypothetical protein [Chromobacterium piscinae]
MNEAIRFIHNPMAEAEINLRYFVEMVRLKFNPLRACNKFEDDAWSIEGIIAKNNGNKFLYFSQNSFNPKEYRGGRCNRNVPAVIPVEKLLREPFRSFAKSILTYLHVWQKTTSLNDRLSALRYLEMSLWEVNGSTSPTATTPEILNRACYIASKSVSPKTSYHRGMQLSLIYRYMVELGLVNFSSEWVCPIPCPIRCNNRIGKQFDEERKSKLPSPEVLEALAEIFNSDDNSPLEIFVSSVCALMLCAPERIVEVLYAPLDILVPDWIDPTTGDIGTGLRWFPVKGAAPQVKIVIPSMRDIAIRAIDRLRKLSAPARKLALWYEQYPDRLYLPPHLEYLRQRDRLDQNEIYAILFGGIAENIDPVKRLRVRNWLDAKGVTRTSKRGGGGSRGTTVKFTDLEYSILRELPINFPIMDHNTGMRYSEALCLARVGEFNSCATLPSACAFENIRYGFLRNALKSCGLSKSIFERRGYQDKNGNFLFMNSKMLRHYLNTLVRQSSNLSEDEIALWSGRKRVGQNKTYNHQSDRDVIVKLREAVGDKSKSVGPFSNIDDRIFINRGEFASIKIITAHTTEFGYCIHDYAQSTCQVHQDCMNCNEQVCIKGDARGEGNLRKTQLELIRLQEDARAAFDAEVLNAAEWFTYQSRSLELINKLVSILDDPGVPLGAVIQLEGVTPPSRIHMIKEEGGLHFTPISGMINSMDDIHRLLTSNDICEEASHVCEVSKKTR